MRNDDAISEFCDKVTELKKMADRAQNRTWEPNVERLEHVNKLLDTIIHIGFEPGFRLSLMDEEIVEGAFDGPQMS
jgi:hypothetical protein